MENKVNMNNCGHSGVEIETVTVPESDEENNNGHKKSGCKKILYVSADTVVSYDYTSWYVNNEKKDGDNTQNNSKVEDLAKIFAKQVAGKDIGRMLSHFKNVAVLTAAGTSLDNGNNSGKTRTGLWNCCISEIDAIKIHMENNHVFNKKIQHYYDEKDIEHFLSHLLLFESINDEIIDDSGNHLVKDLKEKIAKACKLDLDTDNIHHGDFLVKLTARKPSDPRLQLYTTNYDTLFEQAAQQRGFTVIDGFSFAHPRVFNGVNFDRDIVYRDKTRIKNEESFVSNVFQLFKIHGSVDWEEKDGKIYQVEKTNNPCIIYPASNKYESSYEQPYFEMMANFQKTLRKESTLLIVTGFGFGDKHIQNVIKDAVNQNPNFHLLIVCYGRTEENETGITETMVPDYIDCDAKLRNKNVSVLFSTFKDFVEIIPTNKSYQDDNENETI